MRKSYLSEPRPLFTEQSSLGNASRVHARKNNSGVFVVFLMQLGNGHHVANLN
jgi:hypothetical protein